MRTSLSLASASLILVAAFVGCGGNVVVDPASTGLSTTSSTSSSTSTGFGGSPVMTVTDATSSSTGIGTSTGFGGNPGFGGSTGFGGMNGVGGSVFATVATSSSNVTTTGSSTDASSSSSGGTTATCDQCFLGSCQMPLIACEKDTTCRAWTKCAQACFQATPLDPGCFAKCDAEEPGAKASYDALYACVCSTCSAACTTLNACAAGTPGGP